MRMQRDFACPLFAIACAFAGGILLFGSGQVQLPRRIAPGWRERIHAAPTDIGRQGRHGAQGLAQRGAIVCGNPAAEVQEALIQRRFLVQESQRFLRGGGWRPAVCRQNYSGQLARSEQDQDPATGLNAPAQ